MTQEALKLALEALEKYCTPYLDGTHPADEAITAIKEALRENAMREVQRLGQEIEQEPWCMKMNGCKTKCEDCPVEVVEPEQEQEPVAWMHIQGRHQELSHFPLDDGEISRGWEQYPLYTTPPQRTWVGLTEEEILAEIPITTHRPATSFARAIEAKLKEKNNAA